MKYLDLIEMSIHNKIERFDEIYHEVLEIYHDGNYSEHEVLYDKILSILSDLGHAWSMILYADRLCFKDLQVNKDFAIRLYKKALRKGEKCAAYNLYITYAELGKIRLAEKYYEMARESRFPFALEHDFMKHEAMIES